MMRLRTIALTMIAALAAGTFAARADTMSDIKQKGTLTVGVKADYPPFGYRNPSGQIVGMEIDLAKDVAKRLGVKAEFLPVVASNRMQFLEQGRIDLMIATMSITPERARVVGIVEPAYYASGVATIDYNSAGIKSPTDLEGKPLCAVQGSFYNREVGQKFVKGDLVAFKSVPEGEQALLNGRCVGFLFDDVILLYQKKHDTQKWADFNVMEIKQIEPLPWGVAVRKADLDGPWGKFMSQTIVDWHKSGKILALEKNALGQNTDWLIKMHDKYSKGS